MIQENKCNYQSTDDKKSIQKKKVDPKNKGKDKINMFNSQYLELYGVGQITSNLYNNYNHDNIPNSNQLYIRITKMKKGKNIDNGINKSYNKGFHRNAFYKEG